MERPQLTLIVTNRPVHVESVSCAAVNAFAQPTLLAIELQPALTRNVDILRMAFFRPDMSTFQKPNHRPAPAPWIPDTPCVQSYFTFSQKSKRWNGKDEPSHLSEVPSEYTRELVDASPRTLTIISWNIDFMRQLPQQRMSAALSHLEAYLSSSILARNAVVILLQEMVASDLHLIQSTPWIQQRFHITDQSRHNWANGQYGTTTLIDKRLQVKQVFRVHYQATRMGRDALYTDISFPTFTPSHPFNPFTSKPHHPQTPQTPKHPKPPEKTFRIVNTHLESLRASPPLRPLQLSTASHFMRGPTIHASILAGDLNAIEPFDRTLHRDNGLKDAYLKLGGEEDKEEGYTWGQMAGRQSREKFGCCRMDKVLYAGGVKVERLERIGMGVQVEGEREREMLKVMGDLSGGWVTDHLGLRVDFEIVD